MYLLFRILVGYDNILLLNNLLLWLLLNKMSEMIIKSWFPCLQSGKPYGARYIGSMVADFHRNLLYGGILALSYKYFWM